MKNFLMVLTFLTAFGAGADTGPTLKYSGDLQLLPKIFHKEAINAKFAAYYGEAGKLTSIQLKTDKPVAGLTDFPSVEQATVTTALSERSQVSFAFRLQGPPHKWYFVFVGDTADSGLTLQGPIYKVALTLPEIQLVLQNGVISDPSGWKKVGSGVLKFQ